MLRSIKELLVFFTLTISLMLTIGVGVTYAVSPSVPTLMKTGTVNEGKLVFRAFYLYSEISHDINIYEELITALNRAHSTERIYIFMVDNNGGSSFVRDQIITAIEESKAEVTIAVHGSNFSAAADITCFADKLYMSDRAILGFHYPQAIGFEPTAEETKQIYEHEKSIWTDFCAAKGILPLDYIKTYDDNHKNDPATIEKKLLLVYEYTLFQTVKPQFKAEGWE